MSKSVFFLFSVLLSINCAAQGLVAHWDMNGSTNDVSGNGHVSHASFVTPAVGKNGVPNTAYYFNGTNSMISTPYTPDLSLSNYSICAVVKVLGFYAGPCQANMIVARGFLQSPGAYALQFFDNSYDGNNCSAFDSTKEVFNANAGATGSGGPGIAMWSYTPTIARDVWYKVVATWDGTKYQIFVNDTLKTSLTSVTGGVFGTSTDSLAIGFHPWTVASGYPWPFKGVIDDIKIYNRVLNDSEIKHYGDTCGQVLSQTMTSNSAVGSTATFSVTTSTPWPTYQWQQDIGTGFTNLTNSGPYSGVTTNVLTISGVTAAMAGNHYRCLISNSWCKDTTASALLTTKAGIDNGVTANWISVYPNPVHDQLAIRFGERTESSAELINTVGQCVLQQKVTFSNNIVDVSKLPTGFYFLKVRVDGEIFFRSIIKD